MARPKKPTKSQEELEQEAIIERIKADTRAWIKTAADDKAARAGHIFDAKRGQYVCDWLEKNCYLYQGAHGGKPIKLIPYQREFVMRLFGWVYRSPEWEDAYIRRFNFATLLCAKKNGKSPLLAAIGLYLTCADNEEGQRVYVGAKNGRQARDIVQEHAIAMVEKSPSLREICTIHKGTFAISHNSTRSRMMVLSGDDTAGAKANEGINGSVLIDELHVFDREMYERTGRAGISRKEPLNLAVSTAGDDPSSYGFERTQYGRAVNAGERDDPHFLHVEYAAPQKATNEDIADNLIEYGKAANPAWGHLIRQSEFKSDYEKNKDNPREMARVKQYRLNLWIGSVSPWLNESSWGRCAQAFTLEQLKGRDCFLGLDLSRTRDMTAAVFMFPSDDEREGLVKLWPLFWLPQRIAEARRNLFPYMEWAEKRELTLTPGNVVDYTVVEEEICAAAEEAELQVQGIYFDQTYAEELTQRLADRLNCNRTAVKQSLMTLSPLAKEFERKIDAELIHHPNNSVLNWQVSHVQVWTDNNQNCRPVKPDPNSGKSVDGILAILDTFAAFSDPDKSERDPQIITMG